jgi:hypothetical protein
LSNDFFTQYPQFSNEYPNDSDFGDSFFIWLINKHFWIFSGKFFLLWS